MEAASLWAFSALSLTVALTPGASWLYVMNARVCDGTAGATAAIAGNATGILCHTLLAAVGLSAALRYSTPLFLAVKLLGALYLVWLAIDTIRKSTAQSARSDNYAPNSLARIWRNGMLMNLLNPKAALLLLAVLPQFIDTTGEQAMLHFALLGSIHAAIASCVLTAVAMLTDAAGRRIVPSAARERMFRWVIGIIMLGFAGALLMMAPPAGASAPAYAASASYPRFDASHRSIVASDKPLRRA